MRSLIPTFRRPSLPAALTFLTVALAVGFVFWEFNPALLFTNSTTTGGDTGAHVATAAYLKSSLLPHLHLTGWDPQWYDGFPLYTFYFPLPDALAAVAGYVIPFNIAFKLMTALGSLSLPVAAWAFGRLSGLERPAPAVLAVSTLPFLFDQSFTIYGGNIYSTMAGEYAYSLGLSVALLFLGVVARGLRTGRLRATGAVLLAACMLCHLVAGMFALVGAFVVYLLADPRRERGSDASTDRQPSAWIPSRRQLWWMITTIGVGLLLVSWWLVPFGLEEAWTTNMGWVNVRSFKALFMPGGAHPILGSHLLGILIGGDRWVLVLAAGATVIGLALRRRPLILLSTLAAVAYLATVYDPQGKLYNTRFVPLWWLCAYLLAGACVSEAGVGVARLWRRLRTALWWNAVLAPTSALPPGAFPGGALPVGPVLAGAAPGVTGGPMSGLVGSPGVLAGPPGVLVVPPGVVVVPVVPLAEPISRAPRPDDVPGGDTGTPTSLRPPAPWLSRPRFAPWSPGAAAMPVVGLLLALAVVIPPLNPQLAEHLGISQSSVPSWVQWNYSGAEAKPGWPEFQAVVDLTRRGAAEYGCGRAFWEYSSNLDRFGTPMSLMLLPSETNGCVDTQEGLLFESSTSTPFHFLDQSELSAGPSDAMVASKATGLPNDYSPTPNVILGVQHLQLLGVKFLLASSPEVEAQADVDPDLTLVGTTGPWNTQYQGTVTTTWKLYHVRDAPLVAPVVNQPEVLTGVGQSQTSWLPPAVSWYMNPADWSTELVEGGPPQWARTVSSVTGVPRPEAPVTVSRIRSGPDQISFHVDRIGVPVVVRVSYFPAWQATGAQGPWRAEPNLMVVVPTSHDVTLRYGTTGPARAGGIVTLVGAVGLVALFRRRMLLTIP